MYTQCRGCGEVFVIEVDHLTHARGQVRCNMCGTVFDGLETLSAAKPHEDDDLILHDFDNAPPLLTKAYQPFEIEELENEDTWEETPAKDALPEFVENSGTVSEVPFVAAKKAKKEQPNTTGWVWTSLSVFMLLLFLWQAQYAIAQGRVFPSDSPLRAQFCAYITCVELNETVDLSAISLVSRNIRPHPGRDSALIISASMINTNDQNNQFPALEIKLSNLNGEIVAMRRFLAQEYVSSDVIRAGFVSNTLIPVNLEIQSPGDDAVAFEIGFVQP